MVSPRPAPSPLPGPGVPAAAPPRQCCATHPRAMAIPLRTHARRRGASALSHTKPKECTMAIRPDIPERARRRPAPTANTGQEGGAGHALPLPLHES